MPDMLSLRYGISSISNDLYGASAPTSRQAHMFGGYSVARLLALGSV